ncbi:hypothetical protein SGUI_1505 [Serinicoccus hydrothermalis]|uniref:Nudix hydrolase domain-containing protein n=1 Tax=Serinicoccus hydrothermalis TaxID=1758689 RepID=A0A1B1NBX0_9MICO|nr:NUDIX domain-containing protein [Serinicoccus hydrothermalis]ANS78901.1 hypothetical protein SGUI_1505 [Serinicoccus hydrothermalis]
MAHGLADQEPAYRDFAVPPVVADAARAWLATPEDRRAVAEPRRSATVMLLRDRPELEVFVLRRAGSMAFAAGMLAFPGGGVDTRDADRDVPWAGPSAQEWAGRLGTDADGARELVTAAAREVFEECGVLLAGPAADEVVSDLRDPVWREGRAALLDRSLSFAELLARHDLVLRTDLLGVRGRWITPECEPRRYDTTFFAARMPEGQRADDASTEAEVAGWRSPGQILQDREAGRDVLLPPTLVMVEELAGVSGPDLDDWVREPVQVRPVLPVPVEHGDSLAMRIPR